MIEPVDGGGGTAPSNSAYNLVAWAPTSRVAGDQTIQNVIQVTARSQLYGVTFTWFVDPQNWTATTRASVIGAKTFEVNDVCGHPNVIGFRTVQDQDRSRLLLNYAVITVGTDDGSVQDDVVVGMQKPNSPAAFAKIDALWQELQATING